MLYPLNKMLMTPIKLIGNGATKAQFNPKVKEIIHMAKHKNVQFMYAKNKLNGPESKTVKNKRLTIKAKLAILPPCNYP